MNVLYKSIIIKCGIQYFDITLSIKASPISSDQD